MPSDRVMAETRTQRQRTAPENGQRVRMARAIDAAWPDLLSNLQVAYTDLVKTRFDLERRADELQAAHDLVQQVITSMSEALFLLDTAGRIIRTNPAGLALLGIPEEACINRPLSDFFPNPEVPTSSRKILAQWPEGVITNLETELPTAAKGLVPASLSATVMRDRSGKITGVLLVIRDITERKRAEIALRQANNELEQRVQQRTAELSRTNAALAQEVAEREHAEKLLQQSHLQLRLLSARVQEAREDERTAISREIHDELGGNLTAIKMEVIGVMRGLQSRHRAWKERLAAAVQLIDATVQAVRRIATELRPGILDDFGLPAAIEWQLQQFSRQTGIQTHLDTQLSEFIMERKRTTAIFRIFQETLTNIARHAQASKVSVALFRDGGHLLLQVRDNGRGIRAQDLTGTKSLGLVGMRERVHLLQGELTIAGKPGEGTIVEARIPVGGLDEVRPDVL